MQVTTTSWARTNATLGPRNRVIILAPRTPTRTTCTTRLSCHTSNEMPWVNKAWSSSFVRGRLSLLDTRHRPIKAAHIEFCIATTRLRTAMLLSETDSESSVGNVISEPSHRLLIPGVYTLLPALPQSISSCSVSTSSILTNLLNVLTFAFFLSGFPLLFTNSIHSFCKRKFGNTARRNTATVWYFFFFHKEGNNYIRTPRSFHLTTSESSHKGDLHDMGNRLDTIYTHTHTFEFEFHLGSEYAQACRCGLATCLPTYLYGVL